MIGCRRVAKFAQGSDRLLVFAQGLLEELGVESDHATPTAPHTYSILAVQDILKALSFPGSRKPGEERNAHAVALRVPCGEHVVEFKRIDKVNSAGGSVLRLTAFRHF